MTTRIVGIFATRNQAEQAVRGLLDQHIPEHTISVITGASEQTQADAAPNPAHVAGAIAGGGALAFAGLASLLVPYLGPLLAAGPLVAAVGAAGSVTSERTEVLAQLEAALVNNGLTDGQAKAYASSVLDGNSIVAVDVTEEHVNTIADIFHGTGGTGLDYRIIDEDGPA